MTTHDNLEDARVNVGPDTHDYLWDRKMLAVHLRDMPVEVIAEVMRGISRERPELNVIFRLCACGQSRQTATRCCESRSVGP